MTKIKDAKIRVTLRDSRSLTGIKCDNWNGYHIREEKKHCVTLLNTDIIPGIHANLFSVALAQQKYFQVTTKGKTQTLKKHSSNILLDNKMANNGSRGFLLITKFYKSANDAALLAPKKRNPECKSAVHKEDTEAKNK